MDSVLTKINRKIEAAKRNFFFFMDNAPCHPENFVVLYSNIKVLLFFTLKYYVATATSRCRYLKKFKS